MPFHKGLLPREGFSADTILALIRHTALNPALLLPLVLLARLTKKGQDLSILHPVALWRLRGLLYLAVARRASAWLSDRVRNNWVADGGYDWDREVVLVTGGAGGIGGAIVRMFEERGVTVVVLDVQPMSFAHCEFLLPFPSPLFSFYLPLFARKQESKKGACKGNVEDERGRVEWRERGRERERERERKKPQRKHC